MIIRILGVIVGLLFIVTSGLMLFFGQDELIGSVSILLTGLLFALYGFLGPLKLGKYFPGTVLKIGAETMPKQTENDTK